MDQDKIKRAQSLKVIISEAIMVLAVIATVIVLALIVSGYWLNSDFKVERQGLLQISSVPTGATVKIDGDSSWLQRTNTSKVLSSGEHTVVLSKDGYDTWSKTIVIREGLLYRIHYPRLFLKERESEKVVDLADATFISISPDRSTLLAANATTKWSILPLDSEKITPKTIDVSKYLPTMASDTPEASVSFMGQITKADWAKDNAHVLLKIANDDTAEWILININNIGESINLTKEFGTTFDDIQMLNNSASSLLALKDQSLRKIDTPSKQISAILVEGIISLDHYENEVIFVANNNLDSEKKYYLGEIKIGDNKITDLLSLDAPAKVAVSRFYDEKYITILSDNQMTLYKAPELDLVSTFSLTFDPYLMRVGHDGEFVIMQDGAKLATLDMESLTVREWTTENVDFGWLDNDMIYVVSDDQLIVYDFDGLNRRIIAEDVSSYSPATITDDKWLYYLRNSVLIREWLIPR